MNTDDAERTLLLELNRSMYKFARIALRPFLGKKKRDNLLERIWPSSYNLPEPILALMPRSLRKKWLRYYRYSLWAMWLEDKTWEPNVINYLSSIRGKLFVDVGANLGIYCAKLWKNFERTIAIEADPNIYGDLSKRVPTNCKTINLAVSNIEGSVNFYASAPDEEGFDLGCGTMFPPGSQEWNQKPASNMIKVRTAPLSQILANEAHIDLVKVDVEGAEWLVLEGAEPIMERIKNWVIELHQPSRKHELEARMKGYGFEEFEWLDPMPDSIHVAPHPHGAFHRIEANVET